MAFTEEQEEVLKRIIEAFQNGKKITDLPRVPSPIVKSDANSFPIEIIRGGRSAYIIAGDLNDALNSEDKNRVNTNIKALQRRADYLERPQISVETKNFGLIVRNYEWYEEQGYGLYLFRNITSRNRIGDRNPNDGRRDYEYYKNWRPKGFNNNTSATGKRDDYEIFDLDEEGTLLKDGKVAEAEALIDYSTFVGSNEKTYLRVRWGKTGKKIDISRTRATLTFELGLAYGEIYQAGGTQRLRVEDMVSNLAKFKIMVIWQKLYKDNPGRWTFKYKL